MLLRKTLPWSYRLILLIVICFISLSFFAIGKSKIFTRNKLRNRNIIMVSEGFQSIDETNDTYVFSAHMDVLSLGLPGVVVVLALTKSKEERSTPLKCLLQNTEKEWLVNAEITRFPESHGFRYFGAFIGCPLNTSDVPSSVSVVSLKKRVIQHKLPIPPLQYGLEVNFTVCVPPLHRYYDDVSQLVEFVEVNQIMGANKLVFYNHSVSPRVSDILTRYANKGQVDVIDWRLPFEAYTIKDGYVNVHYFAQLTAINDCLYRNRYKTRYIISTDLDEFLVPRIEKSWMGLTTSLLRQHPSAGAFIFQSYLFYKFLPNHNTRFSQKDIAKKFNSLTLLKTNRTLGALPINIRPKYLYDPKRVYGVGVHGAWGFIDNFVSVDIEPDVCAINHYRDAMVSPSPRGNVLDVYMHSYQDEIADRLKSRWTEILANKMIKTS